MKSDLLLRAARGETLERPPVWMMRQAGRYLSEYQELRKGRTFQDLSKDPKLACEVSLQPLRILDVDGVILFADILTPFDAIGLSFDIDHGGPRIHSPIRSAEDLKPLSAGDPRQAVPFVFETLERLRTEIDGYVPLIGFCGAPFTLAAYAVEGGGSKDYRNVKAMAYNQKDVLHALLKLLAEVMGDYLVAQVEAGAQMVQVFDTWAGQLSLEDYLEFALPYERQVIQRVQATGVPVVLYVRGGVGWLEHQRGSGADVISLDWRVSMEDARKRLGMDQAVQGNLDPCVLLSDPETVTKRALEIMRQAGKTGHILNLGHGILPPTPRECAKAFVEAAQRAAEVES